MHCGCHARERARNGYRKESQTNWCQQQSVIKEKEKKGLHWIVREVNDKKPRKFGRI